MAKSYRFDRATIQKIETADGFLRGRVTLARTGVFPYLTSSGKIRLEAKLPEELLSHQTIESGNGKPVSDGHPSAGLIRSDNYEGLVKGSLSNIEKSGDYLIGLDTVFDAGLIADILSGEKVEVSIGFEQELDETPGYHKGERYDAVQRNIRINHLAHVKNGRAGETVRFHNDSGLDFAVMQDPNEDAEENKMKTFRKDDGSDIQVEDEIHPVLMAQKSQIEKLRKDAEMFAKKGEPDEKDAEIAKLKKRIKELEGTKSDSNDLSAQVVELSARLDAAISANEELQKSVTSEAFDMAVNRQIELRKNAENLIPDVKLDGLTERDTKLLIIAEHLPFKDGVKLDELEAVRIDAQYEAAVNVAAHKASNGLLQPRVDAAPEGQVVRQNLYMDGLK